MGEAKERGGQGAGEAEGWGRPRGRGGQGAGEAKGKGRLRGWGGQGVGKAEGQGRPRGRGCRGNTAPTVLYAADEGLRGRNVPQQVVAD